MLSIYSCVSSKPERVSILASRPMENSWKSCYPTIETIYESDLKITLVVYWGQIAKSENIILKWAISDDKDNVIFKSEKYLPIKPNIIWYLPVNLDRGVKAKLVPGMYKVNLYIDGQLVAHQNVQYVAKSIRNKNVQQAVILPFKEITTESNLMGDATPVILNTIAHSIYSEVKRIIPDSIPHYIVEQKIGKLLKPNCFENKECVDFIKNTFGESIFISGYIKLVKFEEELAQMRVDVYNAKTGEIKEFRSAEHAMERYDDLIHDLLKGVMQKEGLLDYLKKCE